MNIILTTIKNSVGDILNYIKHFFYPYPIQYLIDFWGWLFPTNRLNWYDRITNFFQPKQNWIKDCIEWNNWCDKPELIRDFSFGCIVHLIEKERWFQQIDFTVTDHHSKFARELQECYTYIKVRRPNLQKQLSKAYDNIPISEKYNVRYAEVNKLIEKIDKLDNEVIIWVAENKGFMWT